MIFATEKHPKGPSLTRWKHHAIALSGNILHIDLPPSNDKDTPKSAIISTDQFELYNTEAYTFKASKAEEICSTSTLITRYYCYRSFLFPGLGSIDFTAYINQLHNRNLNLFKLEQLSDSVKKNFELNYSGLNARITACDPLVQKKHGNKYSPLTWQAHHIKESKDIKSNDYAIALTDIHFVNITFRYLSVYEPDPPWVLMGKELEQRIMNTIRIDFSPSVLLEQQAAMEA